MHPLTRRRFLHLALAGASKALLGSCMPRATPEQIITPSAPTGSAPSSAQSVLVQNENRSDRNVRYFRPFAPPSTDQWRLDIQGLVSNPLRLSFSDVQSMPLVQQSSRMKCVECWSFKADWGGFTLQSLLQQVQPTLEAQHIRMSCADGYWEVLAIEELLRDRVLFAYRMDDALLAPEYGSPLRLIVPWKYAYKGAKCITSLEFVAESSPGYWPTVGPYTTSGDIQVGFDLPQETGERVRIAEPATELLY